MTCFENYVSRIVSRNHHRDFSYDEVETIMYIYDVIDSSINADINCEWNDMAMDERMEYVILNLDGWYLYDVSLENECPKYTSVERYVNQYLLSDFNMKTNGGEMI